jgi:hypothetical protein
VSFSCETISSCWHPWITGTSALEVLADGDTPNFIILNLMPSSCFHMFQRNNSLTTWPWNAGDILPRLHEGMPVWHTCSRWEPGPHQRQWFFQHGVWLPLSRRSDECITTVTILSKSAVTLPFFLHHDMYKGKVVIDNQGLLYIYASTASMAVYPTMNYCISMIVWMRLPMEFSICSEGFQYGCVWISKFLKQVWAKWALTKTVEKWLEKNLLWEIEVYHAWGKGKVVSWSHTQ